MNTMLPGVITIEPDVFGDPRGFFMESWNRQRYAEAGLRIDFVQDNLSFSQQGVLRGLHFQNPHGQGKLIYVLQGEIFDVAVDIRVGSPSFGKWVGNILSSENKKQIYIPEGFAHGFCVTSSNALITYKCTDFYDADAEGGIVWNDPDIGITWPIKDPKLSAKDLRYSRLKDNNIEFLPQFGGCINAG